MLKGINSPFTYCHLGSAANLTLPDHVKRNIFWSPAGEQPAGYYILNPVTRLYDPVEFINNYWYLLDDEDKQVTTSLASHIEPHTSETGYWHIYKPQHPLFQPVLVPTTSEVTLDIPIEPRGGPLTDDPAISPFLTAANPQAAYLEDSSSEEDAESTESLPSSACVPLPLSRALTPLTPQEEQILAA